MSTRPYPCKCMGCQKASHCFWSMEIRTFTDEMPPPSVNAPTRHKCAICARRNLLLEAEHGEQPAIVAYHHESECPYLPDLSGEMPTSTRHKCEGHIAHNGPWLDGNGGQAEIVYCNDGGECTVTFYDEMCSRFVEPDNRLHVKIPITENRLKTILTRDNFPKK